LIIICSCIGLTIKIIRHLANMIDIYKYENYEWVIDLRLILPITIFILSFSILMFQIYKRKTD
jgi:hypothetical protein